MQLQLREKHKQKFEIWSEALRSKTTVTKVATLLKGLSQDLTTFLNSSILFNRQLFTVVTTNLDTKHFEILSDNCILHSPSVATHAQKIHRGTRCDPCYTPRVISSKFR